MELNCAEVLITGGSDGIGKGLAARLIATACKVMITGRNALKLKNATEELPGLQTYKVILATRKSGSVWQRM